MPCTVKNPYNLYHTTSDPKSHYYIEWALPLSSLLNKEIQETHRLFDLFVSFINGEILTRLFHIILLRKIKIKNCNYLESEKYRSAKIPNEGCPDEKE